LKETKIFTDMAARIAANIAKLPDLLKRPRPRPTRYPCAEGLHVQHEGGRRQPADPNGPPLFLLYHGVETRETVGLYPTFWALLDLDDPSRILRLEDEKPVLEANPELTSPIARQMYPSTPVVFTTGAADAGDHCIVASGEADLACRITNMPKALFA
jgi:hypothetical protein